MTSLTCEQQTVLCQLAAVGCDRVTARNFLGASAEALHAALKGDPAFAAKWLKAQATAEFQHMKNIFSAAKDEKHWRASVWWLERMAPERFARRGGAGPSPAQWEQMIQELADAVVASATGEVDRAALIDRLTQAAMRLSGEANASAAPTETDDEEIDA